MLEITCQEQICCHVNKVPDILLLCLHDCINYPPPSPSFPFTFQYTNYDYGDLYDYTEGELTTDAPPTEQAKTEVTPPVHPTHPPTLSALPACCWIISFKKTPFLHISCDSVLLWRVQKITK